MSMPWLSWKDYLSRDENTHFTHEPHKTMSCLWILM